MDCYSLPPLKEPCPQGSRCGTCRGYGFCEEMLIFLPELIFTFPCELKTSLGVPSNLNNGDAALLQPLDFTIHDFHWFFNEVEFIINEEEKQIEEDQAANARYWKIHACYDDDDDDYTFAITPNEPVNSLSMWDEHLDIVLATESDEFIKSSVENLVPIPSESKGESECDVPAREEFATFLNILFDAENEFDSSDDQSFYDEDVPEKIFSIPLFEEDIIPMKIDQHNYNAESDLIESLRTHDSSFIISSKIDYLLDEFVGELTLLKSIPPGIDETDYDPEE
uniref:Reverse transcriptase domain-containing protein n=1 Tax=Tanacetum cinerariifolium TaxID=118510 RepID=A0A699HMU1_TANCI|nr:hypothetical protein [Tanacetum cinerariifolium]